MANRAGRQDGLAATGVGLRATGDKFYVKLREPNTGDDEVDVVAADPVNQLAVDAAFERRAPVILELDGNYIRRVQSDLPRDTAEIAVPGRVIITRISTQVRPGGYVAEILYAQPSFYCGNAGTHQGSGVTHALPRGVSV